MEVVKIRLRKPSRVITFSCKNIPLERNEPCIVRTDKGLEYGFCILPPEELPDEAADRFKMTVVRRASDHDNITYKQIQDDENRAKRMCREKIKARNLPMKLVECEYSFDRRKVIFYFTAEERVDFRELVRDLAQELKTRIELRHIQVRDEAKMVGGIGTCGRELCCTTWLAEFMPISMKMAKRQNLSLNPSKISGQCGRLMCCLAYENENYGRAKRSASQPPYGYEPDSLARIRDEMEDDTDRAAEIAVRKQRGYEDRDDDEDGEFPEPEFARGPADDAEFEDDSAEGASIDDESEPEYGDAGEEMDAGEDVTEGEPEGPDDSEAEDGATSADAPPASGQPRRNERRGKRTKKSRGRRKNKGRRR